ncbi:MAG TPA: transposase [Verrucomicrobiae bacterium]|nr:transposase [Verrucomicrobiae bacterium]
MKRRKWTSQQKFQIVLEGLKGTIPLAEICSRHQISQALYLRMFLCDKFLRGIVWIGE